MKKIYLSTILLIGAFSGAFAQSRFGIKGGLNLAGQYIRMDNESSSTKLAPTFHFGAYYDAAISRGFSIQPGLSLEGKGARSEVGTRIYTDKFLYLQLPVNFIGRVQTRSGDFFFGGGPYLAYGIEAKVTSDSQTIDLQWGKGINEVNPFDAGLNALVGYRYLDGLTINLVSSSGLVNISNESSTKYQHRVISLGIAYEFGGSK